MRRRVRTAAGPCAVLAAAFSGCALLGLQPRGEAPSEPLLSGVRQLTFEGRRAGEGYFAADGSRLVFQSEREPGNPFFQIYLLDLETGATRRVSPGAGKASCGWIHPDGHRVLFASTHLDPEARAKQEAELALRERGGQRRYAWDYDEHYDLFAADLATGGLERLTAARGYDAEGSYSPDGAWIAFASNRHAYSEALSAEDRALFERDPSSMMELYLARADGSELRRLTRNRSYDGGPFFGPKGRRIVWRRFGAGGDTAEILSMDREGGDVRQLTRLGALSFAPFFHPSGEYVIFSSNLEGFGNFELYLVDALGRREPVRVTESPGFDGLPAFSPDGGTLAFTSGRTPGGGSQLFLARWDHETARALLAGRAPPPRDDARAGPPPASDAVSAEIDVAELRAHVERLASDEMEGRRTGSEGERLATEYVARAFAGAGLEPAGEDGSWFQPFEFTSGVELGSGNELFAEGARLRGFAVDRDWRPLAFSRNGDGASAPVVFAGYGIVAPASDGVPAYDSYAGLDVADRWVLLLRYLPEDVDPPTRQHWNRYASLRHKAMIARDRGARGILVVSGPSSQVRDPLVRLHPDLSIGTMSVFALSIADPVAQALLEGSGYRLGELQRALDSGEAQPGFELPGVRLGARVDLVQEKRVGRNVLGRLRAPAAGGAPPLVVGAHVDHLGRAGEGDSLAREDERGRVHPGADDNASGVAALIEIAESLAAQARGGAGPLLRDVVFAAWSGEELGLLGSYAYTETLPDVHEVIHGAPRRVAAYLNLDMVGRLDRELLLYGAGSSPFWPGAIERANLLVGLPIVTQADSYLPTDSTGFYLKGVPVLTAFTGSHAEYHTPRDTADRIDYDGIRDVALLLQALARDVATRADLPAYATVESPREIGPRAGLRAYLGTIPSYANSEGPGLALSGVARGGPADAAGLRGGDRVVGLAGQRIESIYDYTYAIDALQIGEPVAIEIVRDGERLQLEITPSSRD